MADHFAFHEESNGFVREAPDRVFAMLDDHAPLPTERDGSSYRFRSQSMLKRIRRLSPMPLLVIMIAGLAISIFFGFRYGELSRTIDANKAQMARNLADPSDSSLDPSIRIAKAVESDKQLFDDTLLAVAAKRTAGLISMFGLCVAILAIALVGTGDPARSRRDNATG